MTEEKTIQVENRFCTIVISDEAEALLAAAAAGRASVGLWRPGGEDLPGTAYLAEPEAAGDPVFLERWPSLENGWACRIEGARVRLILRYENRLRPAGSRFAPWPQLRKTEEKKPAPSACTGLRRGPFLFRQQRERREGSPVKNPRYNKI